MNRITLETLGRKLESQRGSIGLRETAKVIGISPATLSRVERGYLPDLQTFKKICDWMHLDPGSVLGTKVSAQSDLRKPLTVHFKKDAALRPETAKALVEMILAAQRALALTEGEKDR